MTLQPLSVTVSNFNSRARMGRDYTKARLAKLDEMMRMLEELELYTNGEYEEQREVVKKEHRVERVMKEVRLAIDEAEYVEEIENSYTAISLRGTEALDKAC